MITFIKTIRKQISFQDMEKIKKTVIFSLRFHGTDEQGRNQDDSEADTND